MNREPDLNAFIPLTSPQRRRQVVTNTGSSACDAGFSDDHGAQHILAHLGPGETAVLAEDRLMAWAEEGTTSVSFHDDPNCSVQRSAMRGDV